MVFDTSAIHSHLQVELLCDAECCRESSSFCTNGNAVRRMPCFLLSRVPRRRTASHLRCGAPSSRYSACWSMKLQSTSNSSNNIRRNGHITARSMAYFGASCFKHLHHIDGEFDAILSGLAITTKYQCSNVVGCRCSTAVQLWSLHGGRGTTTSEKLGSPCPHVSRSDAALDHKRVAQMQSVTSAPLRLKWNDTRMSRRPSCY